MLKREQGRPTSYVYVDVRGRDLTSVVSDLQDKITAEVDLPEGVSIAYAGQFEYLTRAAERMKIVIPATLAIIFLLLSLIFRRFDEALLIMGTLPRSEEHTSELQSLMRISYAVFCLTKK